MTIVVELYGGPGTGKSTTAATVFACLKNADINAELITEYAKEWAWEGRRIGVLDQLYVMAKQLHREAKLLGRVDVVVTDSPVRLANYYVHKYGTPRTKNAAIALVDNYEEETLQQGHRRMSILLKRVKAYNPKGRFEDEAAARAIDGELEEMLRPFGCYRFRADAFGPTAIAEEVLRYLRPENQAQP